MKINNFIVPFFLLFLFFSINVKLCGKDAIGNMVDSKAMSLFENALKYEKQKDFPKAVTFYELALDADKRILAFNDMGLVDKLVLKYQSMVNGKGKNITTLNKLAYYSAIASFDLEKAKYYYEELIKLYPETNEAKKALNMIASLDKVIDNIREERAREQARLRESQSRSSSIEETGDNVSDSTEGEKKPTRSDNAEEREKKKKEIQIADLEKKLSAKQEQYDRYRSYYYRRPGDSPYSKTTTQVRYFRSRREVKELEEQLNKLKNGQ
ncbi:hypothetical protein ACFL35_06285 [Candidatus Riflebacteria bacterium]